ncbi:MAG TPA: hypothetical protein VLZ83_17075 [Edaphocola sp.]|nr:hypothetical protein [Edaphocola sp.]
MKKYFKAVLLFSVFLINKKSIGQTLFKENAFALNCKCSKEQYNYNKENKSYSYLFVDEGIGAMYKIITKTISANTDKNYMLNLFKNETPGYSFRETIYKGNKAIVGKGEEIINGTKMKTYLINFFTKDKFYTISIFAFDNKDLENAYQTFSKSLILN